MYIPYLVLIYLAKLKPFADLLVHMEYLLGCLCLIPILHLFAYALLAEHININLWLFRDVCMYIRSYYRAYQKFLLGLECLSYLCMLTHTHIAHFLTII